MQIHALCPFVRRYSAKDTVGHVRQGAILVTVIVDKCRLCRLNDLEVLDPTPDIGLQGKSQRVA